MTRKRAASAAVIALAVVLAGFGIVWATQDRPDPAAAQGVQVATVLLLTADARLDQPISDDAADVARRAALLRRTWDPGSIRERAARLPTPSPSASVPVVTFQALQWESISATPRNASLTVRGGYLPTGIGELTDVGSWRVELARTDPVGTTRGWRLVRVTPLG